ncbi:MAG: hypothetical protein CL677_08800 [Bdellovibrionaceae bacterium]|nr:hypothetical protein [Pseudobdellovibrionaceae bacterium]|tara:strand:- start:797 stop:1534 length:738 start_codon:yes stop_codon:yes gene_type:complete
MRVVQGYLLCAILAFAGLMPAISAQAKIFKNSYISFELPDNWRCTMEGTEYTCFSSTNKKLKQAVIIFTAKEKGPGDSIAAYEAQLKKTRTIPGVNNKAVTSKVQYVKKYNLNNKTWVDSLHESSEVEAYYTRYVGTVSNGLGILVTFSAHRAYYAAYAGIFKNAIASLKVTANKQLLSGQPGSTGPRPGTTNPIGMGPGIVGMNDSEFQVQAPSGGMSNTKKAAYLLILLSIVGTIYYFLKTGK